MMDKIKNIMPKKSKQKSNEGGYFVTLINDKMVNKLFFCCDHAIGSPYIFTNLIMTKSSRAILPIVRKRDFLLNISIRKSLPVAKPTNMMPNQGIGGYAIRNVLPCPKGMAPGAKKGISAFLNMDVSAKGTNGARLWVVTISKPIIPIAFAGSFINKPKTIKPVPNAAITLNIKTLK